MPERVRNSFVTCSKTMWLGHCGAEVGVMSVAMWKASLEIGCGSGIRLLDVGG
ncbi:hypothetical protein JCM18909_739 [Cutibacterium acnes JCM 18909]|nr:hypothetical protein JCM18909_739 [Cutibacterium acnes JCM 18909]